MAHKKLTISLSEETEKLLRKLAKDTGLKLSGVIEKGIRLVKEEPK